MGRAEEVQSRDGEKAGSHWACLEIRLHKGVIFQGCQVLGTPVINFSITMKILKGGGTESSEEFYWDCK